jgi:hypothetical protein
MGETALGTVVGNVAHAATHRAALTCGTDTVSRAALGALRRPPAQDQVRYSCRE